MVCFPRRDSLALSHHGKCLVLMLLRFHREPSPVQAEHFRDEYNAPAGVENPDTQRTVKGPRSGKWIHCTLLECVFLDNITDECSSWCSDLQWVHQMTEARGEKLWWTFSDSQAGLLARVGGLNSVRHSADPSQQTGKCLCCRANVYVHKRAESDLSGCHLTRGCC